MEVLNTIWGSNALFATRDYRKGETVYYLQGLIMKKETQTSIQIGEDQHIEDGFGAFINHSFEPTCEIQGRHVIAVRPIKAGEELTFNYNVTENKVALPFVDHASNQTVGGRKWKEQQSTLLSN